MKVPMLSLALATIGVSLSAVEASAIPKEAQTPLPLNGSFPFDPRQQERAMVCGGAVLPEGSITIRPGDTVCIASKNFPNNYPTNTFQEWVVTGSSEDITFTISCDVVDIQGSWWCWRDWLIIADHCRARTYCGSRQPSGDLETCFNKVTFLFFADRWGQRQGFHCSVTASGTFESTTTAPETSEETSLAPVTGGQDCQCGEPNRGNRIVGGEETEVNEYPWLVGLSSSLSTADVPFCGAALYNDEWIITAAHCAVLATYKYEVLLNMWDWKNNPTPIVKRSVKKVVVHPRYSGVTLDNDIALMQLSEKVEFGNGIRPVCLPSSSADYAGQDATVAGWGTTASGGGQPEVAMEVTVPVRTPEECQNAYGSFITENMFCAGLDAGGKDSCQGDSGGPLTVEGEDGRHYLAGVVSWGDGCAVPGKYGVYTDVSKYIDFIDEAVTSGNTCAN
ncbi:trypsin-1-like isoform X3 [Penaeus japonicus]|uniref:trypsin-1-like isoform X3 n=1 Tax=Penaeus japonicus TaxID=27405 RepID=UPI001C710A7E|nr:trypsin-1-like isoform X3 [Penaeus japonicus]